MSKKNIKILIGCLIASLTLNIVVDAQKADGKPIKLIVDINGKGNFKSIQEAINSLPDSSLTANTIFIKNGTYHEKIFITIVNKKEDAESWRRTIKDSKEFTFDDGISPLKIDESALPRHLEVPYVRLTKQMLHGCGIWP